MSTTKKIAPKKPLISPSQLQAGFNARHVADSLAVQAATRKLNADKGAKAKSAGRVV